jgi:hypothetical protein
MRKTVTGNQPAEDQGHWLDLNELASVEVSSEDPQHPVEGAFTGQNGWRAAGPGEQTLRLSFDQPRSLSRIELSFHEEHTQRTQEFSLRWNGTDGSGEVVRQQWSFSPGGSTSETETYGVDLHNVQSLELKIRPDLQADAPAVASLTRWRVA